MSVYFLTVTNVYKLLFAVKLPAKYLFLSIEILGFYLQPVFIQKLYVLLYSSGAAALWWTLAKLTAGREGRYFPITSAWMMSNWVNTN